MPFHIVGYNQNGRRKYNVRNGKLDWGDSSNAGSNDFLTDLLPHYVTPRHRRNNIIDEDFHDVILGPRKYDKNWSFEPDIRSNHGLINFRSCAHFRISRKQQNEKKAFSQGRFNEFTTK